MDGGPTDPSEVPLSGAGVPIAKVGAVIGKVFTMGAVTWLGLGEFVGEFAVRIGGVLGIIILALALDAYQRRAASDV